MFANLFRSKRRNTKSIRPSLEHLEDRCTPTISVTGSALVVNGDALADTICVFDNGAGGVTATLKNANGTSTASASGITSIDLNSSTGQDTIAFGLTNALSSNLALELCLNKSSDTVNLDFSKGINGGNLQITQANAMNNDTLSAVFGSLQNATLGYLATLGTSSSSESLTFDGPVNGSTVSLKMDGSNSVADQISTKFVGAVGNSTVAVTDCLGASNSTAGLNFTSIAGSQVTTNLGATTGSETFTQCYGAISGTSTVSVTNYLGAGLSWDKLAVGNVAGSTLNVQTDANAPAYWAVGGTENVTESFGALTSSKVDVDNCLSTGKSAIQMTLTGPIQSSTADFNANGQGVDTMALNAQGVNIDSASTVTFGLVNLKGTATDNLSVNYTGQVDGKLIVDVYGAAGPDTIAVNLTATAGSTGSILSRVTGGTGNDALTLNVFDNSGSNGKSTLSSIDAAVSAVASDIPNVQHTANVKLWVKS